MNWTVQKTDDGWQIGYIDEEGFFNTTDGDPAYKTKAEAMEVLDGMLMKDRIMRGSQRTYSLGVDRVCGIRD